MIVILIQKQIEEVLENGKSKKKIVGGNDAGLFEIKTEVLQDGKNEVYNDYLDFISPPDY